MRKKILGILLLLFSAPLAGQQRDQAKEYLDEFEWSCRHVIPLAEALPEEAYSWRPAPGMRSFGELFMHTGAGNLMLLGEAGVRHPAGLGEAPDLATVQRLQKEVTSKKEIIEWLKRGCEAVPPAWRAETQESLARKVQFSGREQTVYAVYLRLLCRQIEQMGQLIVYARIKGVPLPWLPAKSSEGEGSGRAGTPNKP